MNQLLKATFLITIPLEHSPVTVDVKTEKTRGLALKSLFCNEDSNALYQSVQPLLGAIVLALLNTCMRILHTPISASEAGMGTEQKSWDEVQSAASHSCFSTATICPLSPNDSIVLTRQLSVISSEGGECPNKMSTKRRVCEKKPAEPPLPRKNPNEKLIQAETTETGTV